MPRGKFHCDNENLVSYFPARVYNGIEDFSETIMNPTNCRTSILMLPTKDKLNFTHPKPVYVYTDIIKPNLFGDIYVRLLTSLHIPSYKGYHRFDYPLYMIVKQSFIETISIRVVSKTRENVFLKISIFRAS